MSKNDFLEKLALFYYFSFLDEVKAQSATVRTIKKVKIAQKINQNNSDEKFSTVEFIRLTQSEVNRATKNFKPISLAYSSGYIQLPEKSNWGPWFELRKTLNDRDFFAILYSSVLKFSDGDIAEGSNLPMGTVRYRIGRGLKVLGKICQQGVRHAIHS